ncbi:MAG: GAF domain-containing protein [Chloroflexi bacterium]|nr:GAF domain-containing protein [Chloroflexota bacterium]
MKLNSRSTLTRWGIVLTLAILYFLGSLLLLPILGIAFISFSAVPVAAAGWYFGLEGGIIASLAAIILDNFLLLVLKDTQLYTVDRSGFFMSASILLMVGVGFGQIKKYSDVRLQIESQLRSRERYLSVLRMATSSILNQASSSDRYHDLIMHFTDLFTADHGYYISWDAKQKQATLIASTLPPEQQPESSLLRPDQSAIIEAVLQTGRAMVIEDAFKSKDAFTIVLFKNLALPVHSVLGIPLIAREDVLGIMILACNEPRSFTTEEIEQAEQGGQQVALALRSIQQELKIEKQLHQTTTLSHVEHVLSRSERVGVDAVLQLIVDSAMELIPKTTHVVLHLLDEEQQILIPRSVAGLAEGYRSKLNMRLGKGVAGQVLETGETIYIPDIRVDARFIGQTLPISYRSLLVAPVRNDERRIGTISIHSNDPGAFDPDDASLLSALGLKATIALENASLLDTTRNDFKEINTLYHLTINMVTSLDPDILLKDAVDFLQHVFNFYHVQIYTIDPNTGNLQARQGTGSVGEQLSQQGYFLPAGRGIVGYVAESGESFFTNNVHDVLFFVSHPLLPETQSEAAFPIRIDGKTLGVLDIQEISSRPLSIRQMKTMNAIANQLAVALQKANLYAELQKSLSQEKAMRSQLVQSERLVTMGRLLASVSHELNNPLQAIQNALYLLREETGVSPQGKLDLDIVLSEAERMAHMIEQLRATYRPIQAEDFHLIQINNIVEDVHTLISPHLRHNQIIFEFHPNPEIPPIQALSDQIRQVVLNLLMNAVESMSDGGKLTIETDLLEDANEVLLQVSDTGRGISPTILPNIFEAFVTDKQKGTGLGLTITYDVVLKHRGRITAENNKDRGSTFRVWLPITNREIK